MENLAKRIAEAIQLQGRLEGETPSASILLLLHDLALEGSIRDMSGAYVAFAAAHRESARFVAARIAAKITNQYYYLKLGLSQASIARWQSENRDWSEAVEEQIADPQRFLAVVEQGQSAILGQQK